MSCSRNCSNVGNCVASTCFCHVGFLLPDCSGSLRPGDAVFKSYQGLRWLTMIVAFSLNAVLLQRIVALGVVKFRRRWKQGGCARFFQWFDSQIQTLCLAFLATGLTGIVWIDLFNAEGVFTNIYLALAGFNVSALSILLGSARVVHVFVVIYSKFHAPSKHVATGLFVLSLAFAVVCLVGAGLIASGMLSANKVVNYSITTYVVFLVAGVSLYALTILRGFVNAQGPLATSSPVNSPSTRRGTGNVPLQPRHNTREAETRAQLIAIFRAVQLISVGAIPVGAYLVTLGQTSVVNDVVGHFLGSMLIVLSAGLQLFVAGRQRSRMQTLALTVTEGDGHGMQKTSLVLQVRPLALKPPASGVG